MKVFAWHQIGSFLKIVDHFLRTRHSPGSGNRRGPWLSSSQSPGGATPWPWLQSVRRCFPRRSTWQDARRSAPWTWAWAWAGSLRVASERWRWAVGDAWPTRFASEAWEGRTASSENPVRYVIFRECLLCSDVKETPPPSCPLHLVHNHLSGDKCPATRMNR